MSNLRRSPATPGRPRKAKINEAKFNDANCSEQLRELMSRVDRPDAAARLKDRAAGVDLAARQAAEGAFRVEPAAPCPTRGSPTTQVSCRARAELLERARGVGSSMACLMLKVAPVAWARDKDQWQWLNRGTGQRRRARRSDTQRAAVAAPVEASITGYWRLPEDAAAVLG